jgi:hypothetical protein
MTKQSDNKYVLTDKDVMLLKMGLTEWMGALAAGLDIMMVRVQRLLFLAVALARTPDSAGARESVTCTDVFK